MNHVFSNTKPSLLGRNVSKNNLLLWIIFCQTLTIYFTGNYLFTKHNCSLIITISNIIGSPIQYNSAPSLSTQTKSGWKTYSNEKYGFQFQYPNAWVKEDKEVEVIDLSGTVTSIQVNFSDVASKTTLLVEYHLAPKGQEIYKYALGQYNFKKDPYTTGGCIVKVAGHQALQSITEIKIDGRGNVISPPLRLILVDFLDKPGTGEFQFQLKCPLSSGEVGVANLHKMLTSFVFKN